MKEFTDKERVDWLEKQLVEVWYCIGEGKTRCESFETSGNEAPGALRNLIDQAIVFSKPFDLITSVREWAEFGTEDWKETIANKQPKS